jgi:hypothetical protein
MNRTALVAVACVVLLGIFAAIASSVVEGRRPLPGDMTRSFGVAISKAGGGAARIAAPGCRKTAVEFYECTASVSPRRRATVVVVTYRVWLDDDGCWDTKRRTPLPQPAALGPLRPRFNSLRGCIAR